MPLFGAVHTAATTQPKMGADSYESSYYEIRLGQDTPRVSSLRLDGLGKGHLGDDGVKAASAGSTPVELHSDGKGKFSYFTPGARKPCWVVHCSAKTLTVESEAVDGRAAPALVLEFDQRKCHASLLGTMVPNTKQMTLPCVLHLPDSGSFQISGTAGMALDYDARRYAKEGPYVSVSFPGADQVHTRVRYRLEATALYPHWQPLTDDPVFEGFKRGFLNMFQVNPRFGMLANNASSDLVAFTVFEYAEMAAKAPPLGKGLTCMNLVRATLDKYLAGQKGYGQVGYGPGPEQADVVGWGSPYDSLDTYPSLLIAAGEYVQSTKDIAWGRANFDKLAAWAETMMSLDKDGNGLIEYPRTGNFNDRPTPSNRPANWWDTINFGHEDAFSNALAYRAAGLFGALAKSVGRVDEAAKLERFARKLKTAYAPAFLNTQSGLLAGWRSQDGELHDYAFTFVQGAAVTYGLLDDKTANSVMDHLLAKLQQVGFRSFKYGLPGNLEPIKKGDYVQHNWTGAINVGEPSREDGTDAFQIYENGGATGCWAYFTVKALYKLGRLSDARKVFLPMLKGYAEGNFMGFGENGQSKDWRAWDGTCHGYEGLLVDSFLTLLCVEDELKARRKD